MTAVLVLLLLLGWLSAAAAAPPAPLPLEPPPPPLPLEVVPPSLGLERVPLDPPEPPPLTVPLDEPGAPPLPPWRTLLVKPVPGGEPPGRLACLTRLFGGAEALYDCGRYEFLQGLPRRDFEEARRAFAQLLAISPAHPLAPAARYWLGEIAFREDALGRAAQEFEGALRLGLTGELANHARLGLAWIALRDGQPAKAQARLEELLRAPAAGLAATARFFLGVAHLSQGRPAEARTLLDEVASKPLASPLAEDLLFWQGETFLRLGEATRARDALERFIAAAPTHPLLLDAIVDAGWLLLRQGAAQEAVQNFLWADAIATPQGRRLPEIRAGLVRAYLALDDWPRARETARQFGRDSPRSPMTLPTSLRLADHAVQKGILEEAAEVYQEILDLSPKPPQAAERYATYRLAGVFERLGRIPEASRRYRALRDSGRGAVAQRSRYRLGLLALRARQDPAARGEGETLLREGVDAELLEGTLLLIAEAAIRVGDLDRAVEVLRRHLRAFPESPRAGVVRASLAWTLDRAGKPAEALPLWEAVAASGDPALAPKALLALADLAIRRGENDRAIEVLGRFLTDLPGHPSVEVAALARAVLLVRAEKFGDAVGQLRALLGRFTLTIRQEEVRRALGLALFRQRRFEEALAEFRQAGTLSPTGDPEAWQAAGITALHLGRLADAEDAFNRARRTAPRALALAAEYGLAVAAARQGPEQFRLRAQGLVDRAPDSPYTAALLYALSGLAIERGELGEADALVRRLVKDHGESEYGDDALFRVATVPHALPVIVRDALKELLARYPDSPFREEARYRLAEAAAALGEHETARRALEAFVAANPEDLRVPQALVRLMETHEAQGRKDQAVATARTFLRRFGSHPLAPSVELARGRLLLAQREWKTARTALAAALGGDDPTAAHAQYLLGELSREVGEPEQAVADYMATAYLYPQTAWAPRGLLGAAESYLALGRSREAEVVLKQLLARSDLPPELARRAREALAGLGGRREPSRPETPRTPPPERETEPRAPEPRGKP